MNFSWQRFFPFSESRAEQSNVIEFALDAFLKGGKKFVVCECGTGIGKSAIGITISNYVNAHLPIAAGFTPGAYILTTQKILQDQYLRDFGIGKGSLLSIKSSVNYQCNFYPQQTCAESKRMLNSKLAKKHVNAEFSKCCKAQCPYTVDKNAFIQSPLSITNYSYFMAETMYAGRLEPRQLIVHDECLRGDAKIRIDVDREVSMFELFQNDTITHVISFNQQTNEYEKKRILRRVRTSYDKNTKWIRLTLNVENKKTTLLTTDNHQIWTKNRGYVRADQLTNEDILKFDTGPVKNVTHSVCGSRTIRKLLEKRKNIIFTCKHCNKTFNEFDFKMHCESIICIKKCENQNCLNEFEITLSTGNGKRFCSTVCYFSSDYISKIRSEFMKKNNPMFKQEHRDSMRISWKKTWENSSEEKQSAQLERFINAPKHQNRKLPNKLEQFVVDLQLENVEFTGLGKKWFAFKNGKKKNPDFIVKGTNKVIEVGDVYFWHTLDEIASVKQSYSEIGIDCLYITNKDIEENEDFVISQIHKFVFNHDVVIEKIEILNAPRSFSKDVEHFKYNIEVEDNHNYFANSILVSNCHNVESEISKFIEVTFSEKFAKETLKCKCPSSLRTMRDVYDWVVKTYKPNLAKHIERVEEAIEIAIETDNPAFSDYSKQYEVLDKHICKVNRFIGTFSDDNWIMNILTPSQDSKGNRKFEFKPVDVSHYSDDVLFKFGERHLLMSATIIDKEMFCKTLGIKDSEVAFISIDSPFPIENRPIHYLPIGKMSAGEIDQTLPKMVEIVRDILDQHKNEKGILHAHSFKVVNYLRDHLRDPRLLIQNDANRDEIIRKHVESFEPTVLVSPSMTEGVDLRDDLSRFQVFLKMPFPYLGDSVVKKRMKLNVGWYPFVTARTVIQGVGRSIRNAEDQAVTYILDESFAYFYRTNRHLFPISFQKSLDGL